MEEELKSANPQKIKKVDADNEDVSDLKQKVNVDQAAIEEARAAVGNDEEKIREYLTNNRGL